jgi:3'-phosphoadenosine 5'-phosphosulfate sulfotransferase (PAPS reductase)/FAD synthetase
MAQTPDFTAQDIIILNTSGGKDSQVMIEVVMAEAARQGFTGWIVAAHADLGRVEWAGTRELAERQARFYGVERFEVVSRPQGDLLDQIEARRESLDAKGKCDTPAWPSSDARFCTSDQKTSQVTKLITKLVAEWQAEHGPAPVRVLNCLGIRAQESPARAKKVALGPDSASNGKRTVTRWLPIFDMTEAEVWEHIRQSGAPYHQAYDFGMTRLSCVFCVFASKSDLLIAAKHNPELAREYEAVEIRVRSTFRADLSMSDIIAEAGI